MGTWFSARVWAAPEADPCTAAEKAIRAVGATERRLSTWREDTELAKINAAPTGTPIPVSPPLCQELRQALFWARKSAGAFDPAVGALIRAYDLRGTGRWPSPRELATALEAVGYHKLRLANCQLVKTVPDLLLDEGAFGKGAALDAALAALGDGVKAAELDLGGQVRFFGGQELAVDPVHPDHRQEVVATWLVPPGSVATSGNSERRRNVRGQRLGHILDPRTGKPARDFGSVAVWAPTGLVADCLSTALYVLGPGEGSRFLAGFPEAAAVFLVREGKNLRLLALGPRGTLIPKAPYVDVDSQPWPGKGQKEEP